MLQVLRPVGSGCIYAWPDTLMCIPDSRVNPNMNRTLIPGLFMFPSYGESSTLNGRITTTPSAIMAGENECFHINYEGTLIPKGSLSYTGTPSVLTSGPSFDSNDPRPYDDPVHKVDYLGNTYYYTHPVLYGQNTFSEKKMYSNFQGRYSWQRKSGDTYECMCSFYTGKFQVVAQSCTLWYYNMYDYFVTSYIAYSVEYDPLRGARIWPLTNGVSIYAPVIKTGKELQALVSNKFFNVWTPTGAFSTTIGVPVLGRVPKDFGRRYDDSDLLSRLPSYTDSLLRNQLPDFGELSYQCMKQMKTWDGNGLALSKDLIGLREEVSSAIRLIKGWKNPKNWASMFLSAKYGLPLTVRDVKELLLSLKSAYAKAGPTKVSSSTNWTSNGANYECHYGIWCKPYDQYLDSLTAKLDMFDLNVTFKNAWDLVPFSFVVDWFVDVGNLLDHLDVACDMSKYDIECSVSSIKISRDCKPDDLGFHAYEGTIHVSKYTRWYSRSVFPPSVTKSDLTPNSFDHWIEGGALMVQKLLN